ncbi:MAG: PAS domain S-box protein [Bacteroidota bacterium]|nr:PAS domain S-box protein [Bacteroidota bacterium]MDP4205073.1 PAS domain S-box protein [Bacteroidota bacterium]
MSDSNSSSDNLLPSSFDVYQKIMDALPMPIFYRDKDGIYRNCNKAHEQFIGLTRDELYGKTVYDVQPLEIADIYARRDRELFETKGVQIYETKFRYADGSIHDVVFNKAVIFDDEGEIIGIVGSIFDITERKRAEQRMEDALAANEISSAMLQKMRAGIIIVDKDLKVVDSNPGFVQLIGNDLEELFESVPGLRGADAKKILPDFILKMVSSILITGDNMMERDIRFQGKLLHLTVATIIKNNIVGTIIRDISEPVLNRTEIINRAERVNRQNLETVQKIAFLLGENAAQTEELLNSIIASYQYGEEDSKNG